MDFDGWKSSCTRSNNIWGECKGNSEHKHEFSYYGTPSTYKVVIMNNKTGEVKISYVIHRKQLNSTVEINVNNMSVVEKIYSIKVVNNFFKILASTIIIEIVIAIIMKLIFRLKMNLRNIIVIFFVNLITNVIIQVSIIFMPFSYISMFVIMEVLVIISEYLIYSSFFIDTSKKGIALYTLIANITTAVLTFII